MPAKEKPQQPDLPKRRFEPQVVRRGPLLRTAPHRLSHLENRIAVNYQGKGSHQLTRTKQTLIRRILNTSL